MAIKGFENITHELTEFETETLIPVLVEKLSQHKEKANAIKCGQLSDHVIKRTGRRVNDPRIRKMIEHIRQNHLLPNVCAGVCGYYVTDGPEDLQQWIRTMKQRRNAMNFSISAAEKTLRQMTGYKQPNQHKQRKVDFNQKQTTFFN